mgnify:CR=1 FL=1
MDFGGVCPRQARGDATKHTQAKRLGTGARPSIASAGPSFKSGSGLEWFSRRVVLKYGLVTGQIALRQGVPDIEQVD